MVEFVTRVYSVQKFSNTENITFAPLKSVPYVKYWWECYLERCNEDESLAFGMRPTWLAFVDALEEELYLVKNYDDQYTRWMTMC
jgi:hypothetical protein